jgi:hydroxypyruvate isomerase
VANFSGQRTGDLIEASTHSTLLADYREALKAAKTLGAGTLMVLANELGQGGVVKNPYPQKGVKQKELDLLKGLRMLLDNTPDSMCLVLEPLNTVLDHKGYFLSDMKQAADLIAQIPDKRLRILCDLYHQGMMGDELIDIIEDHYRSIGYFHVADFPGRHEPGTGAADWKSILRTIDRLGYEGFVGFEYSPAGDSGESLRRIGELWESL